jgi:hypothetical protein
LLARKKQCHVSCGKGLYEVKPQNLPKGKKFTKACDECQKPCADCLGNRVNCTLCNPKSNVSGLFKFYAKKDTSGKIIQPTRGTCLSKCPFGYFLDKTNPLSHECKACASPCATCFDNALKCLSCDGSNNAAGNPRYFVSVLDNKCYD